MISRFHLHEFTISIVFPFKVTYHQLFLRISPMLNEGYKNAFKSSLGSPNLGVCFEHAQNKRRDLAIICDHGDPSTMSGVSTALLPRLWRSWHALGPFSIAVEAQ